jgi:hypothetical protein
MIRQGSRDVVDYTRLLKRAQDRSLRRLAEWGDTVFHPREWLLAEAENLEWNLAVLLRDQLNDFLGEEGGAIRKATP